MLAVFRQFRTFDVSVQLLLANEFSISLGFFMLYPYLAGYLSGALGFPAWTIGLVLGIRVLCQQGLTIVGGTLADRIGYKPVLIAGLMSRTVGFLLFGFVTTFPGVLTAAIITGLAGAMFSPASRAYLAAESKGRRAEVYSLANVFGQTGTLLGPVVGVVLLGFSFQSVSIVASIVFLVLSLLQLRYLPEKVTPPEATPRSVWSEWGEVIANRPFILVSIALLSYFTLYNQLYIGIPLEVKRLTGSDGSVSTVFLMTSILTITMQPTLTTQYLRRVGSVVPIAIGMSLMALAFIPLLAATPLLPLSVEVANPVVTLLINLSPVLLCVLLLTFGIMSTQPFTQALIPRLSKDRLIATYFGFYWMWSGIGATIGNTATGFAFDLQDQLGLPGLPWMFMIAFGGISAVSMVLLTRSGQLDEPVPERQSAIQTI